MAFGVAYAGLIMGATANCPDTAFYVAHIPELHVSHETIYTAIYAHPKGELRKDLIACLRQSKSGRKPRSAGDDR